MPQKWLTLTDAISLLNKETPGASDHVDPWDEAPLSQELVAWARNGEIEFWGKITRGVRASEEISLISPTFFLFPVSVSLEDHEINPYAEDHPDFGNRRYTQVLVDYSSFRAALDSRNSKLQKPSDTASSIGKENACKRWLEEKMSASPHRRTITKAQARKEYAQIATVPVRSFDRAWSAAAISTGAVAWKSGGAPRKK